MLKPTKYTNVNFSVIGISVDILKILKGNCTQKYSQLLGEIIAKKGKQAKKNFLLALCFLFSVGKIKYHQEEDAVEYLIGN